jgi:hypothetical protein
MIGSIKNNALGKTMNWFGVYNDFKRFKISLRTSSLWGENIRKFSKPLPNRTHVTETITNQKAV